MEISSAIVSTFKFVV